MTEEPKDPQPQPDAPGPATPAETAAPTAEELAELRRKAADYDQLMDRLKRVTADYINSQKRLERRAEERAAYAIESFARELLLVADDLSRAIKAAREHQPDGTVSAGLELVEKHFYMVLARHGITPIETKVGEPFDSNGHEAIIRRSDGRDGARPRGRGTAARVPPARPSAAPGASRRQRGKRITRFRFFPAEEDSMPTYEYECDACGHRFEEFQQMNDAPLKSCPKCRKRKLRRLIGAGSAVIFKGTGFYQTDYRSKQYSADKSKAEASAAPASCDTKKCEACPKNQAEEQGMMTSDSGSCCSFGIRQLVRRSLSAGGSAIGNQRCL